MGFMMHATNIIAIHKNNVSSNLTKQARLDSFHIFSKAVSIKCGGDANVRFAWYGGSLDELMNIVSFGFTGCNIHVDEDNGGESHGVGISLPSANFSIDRYVVYTYIFGSGFSAVVIFYSYFNKFIDYVKIIILVVI
jgi:hypothetical protein